MAGGDGGIMTISTATEALPRRPVGLITAAVAALSLLQLLALGMFDPLRETVSGLVYAPGGALLFPLMGALMLAGSVQLMRRAATRGYRLAAGLLGIWCVALTLATIFPTDPPGTAVISVIADVHRWAAAVMFAAIPLAGWAIAAATSLTAPAHSMSLRRRSLWCAVAGIGQFLFSLPSLFRATAVADWPLAVELYGWRGVAERALFIAMLAVLIGIARSTDPDRSTTGPDQGATYRPHRATRGVFSTAVASAPMSDWS